MSADTPNEPAVPTETGPTSLETAFREGFLLGVLVGAGHFGGDGKQPHVTLRMHTRHESLFRWIERFYPGGRLYGPYTHGGRSYFQWMARGKFLREELLPMLERRLTPALDAKAYGSFLAMKARYGLDFPESDRPPGADRPPEPGASLSTPTT